MGTKKQIRDVLKEKRKSLTDRQARELSEKICCRIGQQPWFLQAETVCFYYPLGKEVNLLPLAEKALDLGKKIAFPRVAGKEMEFYETASLDDFGEGSFHVMEPVGGTPVTEQRALMVVPGLGFDFHGNRLGYGGGYYDRYFARYPQRLKIGVAYAFQILEGLERERYDVPMDKVVTEEGCFHILG